MRMGSPVLGAAVIVKCGDKAKTIGEFVSQWLALDQVRLVDGVQPAILLVARSAASPVARALAALGPQLAAADVRVSVIFASVASSASAQSWSAPGSALGFCPDIRWARNPRLSDAHEQLVLGDRTAWYGDCMRRDPEKRDAFERFHAVCPQTAGSAQRSFQRLWALSEPVSGRVPHAHALKLGGGEQPMSPEAASVAVAGEMLVAPVVSTRH